MRNPPRPTFAGIAADVVRHAVPVLPLYLLHGTIDRYVLLTAFDLSLGLWLIVATTRDPGDVTSVDPRSRWLVSRVLAVLVAAVFLAFLATLFAFPIALPGFLLGLIATDESGAGISQPSFWVPVAAMSLLAAIRFQLTFESRTTPGKKGQPTRDGPVLGDLPRDRRVSLAAKAAQVTLIATFVALCYVLSTLGRLGLTALPIFFAAALVFYDARPDLAQRIFPKLWQEK